MLKLIKILSSNVVKTNKLPKLVHSNRQQIDLLSKHTPKFIECKTNNMNQHVKTSFQDDHFEINMVYANENGIKKNHRKQFPYIWLRDSCRCESCYDSKNQQVLFDLKNASLNIKPNYILHVDENFNFEIEWSDGHKSIYDLPKLAEHIFAYEIENKELVKPIHWNDNIIKNEIQKIKFDYQEYMTNDNVFKKTLESLISHGFFLLNNVPDTIEHSQRALERISFIQKTLYGEITILEGNINRDHTDSSYSTVGLKAHNDGTYFRNTPGLEVFQMLEHKGNGGDSLLVDGFYCANKLRKHHQYEFEYLTKIPLKSIYKEANKYDMSNIDPVIKLHPITGSLMQIRYNSYDRALINYLPYEDINNYYQSISKFAEIIEDPANEYWFRLNKGEMLFFDNFRILHGRSEFDGIRRLLTAYLPRDDWISKASLFKLIKN